MASTFVFCGMRFHTVSDVTYWYDLLSRAEGEKGAMALQGKYRLQGEGHRSDVWER